jgi:hypothetical protein
MEKPAKLAQDYCAVAHFAPVSTRRRAEIEARAELLFPRALQPWPMAVGSAWKE